MVVAAAVLLLLVCANAASLLLSGLAGALALAAARPLASRLGSYFARPGVWAENLTREISVRPEVVSSCRPSPRCRGSTPASTTSACWSPTSPRAAPRSSLRRGRASSGTWRTASASSRGCPRPPSFLPGDRRDAPAVAIVNETLSRRHFEGRAIGQRVWWPDPGDGRERAFETVGVVRDTRTRDYFGAVEPTVYFAYPQHPYPTGSALVVPAKGDPASAVPALQRWLREFEPHLSRCWRCSGPRWRRWASSACWHSPSAGARGSLLHGIEPGDPMTLVAATALLVVAALAAVAGPARRATAVDPVVALRHE